MERLLQAPAFPEGRGPGVGPGPYTARYTGRMKESGNRALILDRALGLFAARGYDAVGVQEIVEAAGVTKPTLYHYFGSKRGLLEALVAEHAGEFLAEV